ncbi:MAG: hypothetical protein RL434_459 [Pseudomonadota bacterium]|jgi:5-methylcytosine-specific restriction endonuclease McrA
MAGRVRRRLMAEHAAALPNRPPVHCPLCGRPVPEAQRDAHHLVPRSHGGKQTEILHRICHQQIHALLTEAELAKHYNSIEALLAHPAIAAFVAWVRTKPDGFFGRTRKSQRLRS